jgi:Fe-S cluster assembly protein SufD
MSAVSEFLKVDLPSNKTEEYRFTPIARILEKAFPNGFSEGTTKSVDSLNDFLIPGLECSIIKIVDGVYEGQKGGNPSPDVFDQLNASLSNGVLHIHASDKPVFLLNINTGSTNIHNRFSIKVEREASLCVIERTVNLSSSPLFQTITHEISVAENSRIDYYKIQDALNVIEISNTFIVQKDNSHVNTFTLLTDGTLVRNNLNISIDGENCESHFHGLSLLKGDTIGDHHTVVDHVKPNSMSNELYKGVMDDKSKGVFNGKIYVRPQAQKTNAFQSNRNILLTEQATINTKPQLEIWADDVKCSHGCTTGQLDDEALFYLQSRGISKVDARAMLLYAFAMQTTELIANEALKSYIEKLISARLYA